jgi:hypothetical protein
MAFSDGLRLIGRIRGEDDVAVKRLGRSGERTIIEGLDLCYEKNVT